MGNSAVGRPPVTLADTEAGLAKSGGADPLYEPIDQSLVSPSVKLILPLLQQCFFSTKTFGWRQIDYSEIDIDNVGIDPGSAFTLPIVNIDDIKSCEKENILVDLEDKDIAAFLREFKMDDEPIDLLGLAVLASRQYRTMGPPIDYPVMEDERAMCHELMISMHNNDYAETSEPLTTGAKIVIASVKAYATLYLDHKKMAIWDRTTIKFFIYWQSRNAEPIVYEIITGLSAKLDAAKMFLDDIAGHRKPLMSINGVTHAPNRK
jgi:hypothetical protein